MKRIGVMALVAAAMMVSLAFIYAPPADAARADFVGVWYSTDDDGSRQVLTVLGGRTGSYRAFYIDFGASICGWDGTYSPSTVAVARGQLVEAGSSISGDMAVYCMTRPPSLDGTYSFEFTYNLATDSLTDGIGVEWFHR
jgi:hypothetical protein